LRWFDYNILRKNEIPSLRIGREYKIVKTDIIDYLLKVPANI